MNLYRCAKILRDKDEETIKKNMNIFMKILKIWRTL